MSDKHKLLILDDEPEILNSLKRVFRKSFIVKDFTDPHQALAALKEESFAMVISDMKMPVMDGASFLAEAKNIAPDSVRILLTGYADIESTVKAVNQGGIFSYVSKPWQNDELMQLVNNALQHYLIKQENVRLNKELELKNQQLNKLNQSLESTVQQRTKALTVSTQKLKMSVQKQRSMFQQLLDMISLIIADRTGEHLGHNKRVAMHSKLVAEELGLEKQQCNAVYIAALVYNLGKVSLSDHLLSLAEHQLNQEQLTEYQHHAIEGARILAKLPQMQGISEIVKHQFESFDGTGVPAHQKGNDIPLASRIIRLVSDYDCLLLGLKTAAKATTDQAFEYLVERSNSTYDPKLVETYRKLLRKLPEITSNDVDYCIASSKLEEGMITAKEVLNKAGGVMLTQDTQLTQAHIDKLIEYEKQTEFHLSIFVY